VRRFGQEREPVSDRGPAIEAKQNLPPKAEAPDAGYAPSKAANIARWAAPQVRAAKGPRRFRPVHISLSRRAPPYKPVGETEVEIAGAGRESRTSPFRAVYFF